MLEISELSKSFRNRVVLRDVSLRVAQGEIYGLLGANGAGKTTLINLICGLLVPDGGAIKIGGEPVGSASRQIIGIVPQENLLYRNLSCTENLRFFASLYGLQGGVAQKRISHCLEAVALTERWQTIVANLSGGMQRRLSVAVALLHEPRLIILDEPTTGLDIEARFAMWSLLQKLRQQGKTLLITTHLLEEAERLCDHLAILKQGQLLAEGSLADLQKLFIGAQVLTIQVADKDYDQLMMTAESHQFIYHQYLSDRHGTYTFSLPRPYSLSELIELFANIDIAAVTLQPVRLEHIYLALHHNFK